MTIVDKGETNTLAGSTGTSPPDGPGHPEAESDYGGDVRLGDEHVSGVETLCVGESQ